MADDNRDVVAELVLDWLRRHGLGDQSRQA